MHGHVSPAGANAETTGDFADLQHKRRAIHHQVGQLVPRRPVRGHAHGRSIRELDRRAILVGIDFDLEPFALGGNGPMRANAPFVIVHPTRHAGAANFGNTVHRGGRSSDTLQIAFGQGNPFETLGVLFFDKGGRHFARDKDRVIHHSRQERQVVANTFDLKTVQRDSHGFDGLIARRRPSAQFGNHGIVIHADLAALKDAGIIAHSDVASGRIALPFVVDQQGTCGNFRRRTIPGQTTDRRQEAAIGIFRIQAVFNRPAGQRHIILGDGQLFTSRHADHLFNQIDTGDQLGHRVFHLQARVHFQEIEVLGAIDDEFHRAGAGVSDGLSQCDGLFAHRLAGRFVQERAGSFFHNLLLATLDRTFPFAQIDAIAMAVTQHLNFDVARLCDELFDENPVIAKAVGGFVLGGLEPFAGLIIIPGDAHTLATATGGSLDHHRVSDLVRNRDGLISVFNQTHITGHGRHVRLLGDLFRGNLVAHAFDCTNGRANECHAFGGQRLGELAVFT